MQSTFSYVLTNYSWFYSTTIGRSSDLAIIALFRLLKANIRFAVSFNDIFETELLPYSDEFVQDLHLLPFSPNQGKPSLFDTYNVLYFLYAMEVYHTHTTKASKNTKTGTGVIIPHDAGYPYFLSIQISQQYRKP